MGPTSLTSLNAATTAAPRSAPPVWDIFCRVIDNHGDLGVCWRLARGLVARGTRVRLWVDEPAALAWMAPDLCVHAAGDNTDAHEPVAAWPFDAAVAALPGDVVIEAFGCDPPAAFVAAMAASTADGRRPPTWINLEYLSAEDYVERSHRLPSPQWSGPGQGLTKWFFYPGFTAQTGGLMLSAAASPPVRDAVAWLASHGVTLTGEGRPRVSLFCYASAPVAAMLDAWVAADADIDLLITPGHATHLVQQWLQARKHRVDSGDRSDDGVPDAPQQIGKIGSLGLVGTAGRLRVHALPWLPQTDYDTLLGLCDLNLVRGEDSLVSALNAGRPFVWQIYEQDDDAHHHKLAAFLQRYLHDANEATQQAVMAAHAMWNAVPESALAVALPPATQGRRSTGSPTEDTPALLACLRSHPKAHARRLAAQWSQSPDLITQLLAFAAEKQA